MSALQRRTKIIGVAIAGISLVAGALYAQPVHAATSWKFNFQTKTTVTPSGYTGDYGQPFSVTTGYGWETFAGAPLSLVGNGRERNDQSDKRLDTFVQMQLPSDSSGVQTPGRWELVVPNGTYNVTVAAGDGIYIDSHHVINAEGVKSLDYTPPSNWSTVTKTVTAKVIVNDGRLTLDPIGGTNTKINYVDVVQVSTPTTTTSTPTTTTTTTTTIPATTTTTTTTSTTAPTTTTTTGTTAPPVAPKVVYSTTADRAGARDLGGAIVSGSVYAYLQNVPNGTSVTYWLDDPDREDAGGTTTAGPFDLMGTTSSGAPTAFDTTLVNDDVHDLIAVIALPSGSVTLDVNFTSKNQADSTVVGAASGTHALWWATGSNTRITSKCGPRQAPVSGAGDFHPGTDIGVPIGTPVYAAYDGIAYNAVYQGYGNTVDIVHPNGYVSRYAHLSAFVLANGAHVNRGDLIAKSGNTGGLTTGAHLHQELRTNGRGFGRDGVVCVDGAYSVGNTVSAKTPINFNVNLPDPSSPVAVNPPPFNAGGLADGKLFKATSSDTVYVVAGGAKFPIPDPTEFGALGYSFANVQVVSDADAAAVPVVPRNGTLLRERSDQWIWVVQEGARFRINSADEFNAMGFDWNAVRVIPNGDLLYVPTSPREGTLVQERGDVGIWVIQAGARFRIPSADEFTAFGFNWAAVHIVPSGSLATVPLAPSDGTLVKERTTDTLYLVYGGARFAIPNLDDYTRLGLVGYGINIIPNQSVGTIPLVPRNGLILKELDSPSVYITESGKKRLLTVDEFSTMNYGLVLRVVPNGSLAQIPSN